MVYFAEALLLVFATPQEQLVDGVALVEGAEATLVLRLLRETDLQVWILHHLVEGKKRQIQLRSLLESFVAVKFLSVEHTTTFTSTSLSF